MTAREAELAARFLLANLDQIPVYIRERRWRELVAVVRFAEKDAPLSLIGTDNAQYRFLWAQITEFRIRGWRRLNLAKLEELAASTDSVASPEDILDREIGR